LSSSFRTCKDCTRRAQMGDGLIKGSGPAKNEGD
jgi:hypothetical protein